MDILREIKGVFAAPARRFYLGKIVHGAPYMYPRNFCGTVVEIKENKPRFCRNKSFVLLGKTVCFGSPIWVCWHGLGWKDKYASPRFEWAPAFYIYFFKWQLVMWRVAPGGSLETDHYYEMVLWWLNYSDKDIVKAEETWPWRTEDGESTWDPSYLLKSRQSVRDRKLKELGL